MGKIFLILVLTITLSNAWEGYNYDKGTYIEVETYDHRGIGEGPVEYYDYEDGEYKTGYLDMYPGGDGTLTDDETGESFSVEMER